MDELFSLLRLQGHHASQEWDVIVVDCAPTGETLRLLSFPDVARWWIDKVFPFERQILAAARPLARSLLDMPLPSREAFADVRRVSEKLIAMNAILRDREHCTVRLVMNPDRMVIGEAMRTFTYLNLYGFATDAVVVNRIFGDGTGAYFEGWRKVQQEHLILIESAFGPVPVLRAPFFEQEVVGGEMLDRLGAALFDTADPLGGAVLGQLPGADRHRGRCPPAGHAAVRRQGRDLTQAGSATSWSSRSTASGGRSRCRPRWRRCSPRARPSRTTSWRSASMAEPTGPGGPWDPETLRALEARLDRAAAAAERLLGEAASEAASGPPPGGWQRPGEERPAAERFGGWLDAADGELLLTLLGSLRERIPAELQTRLIAALRELLTALRALVEWCLERAQRRQAAPTTVQDIPIL